jgi:hypothetical protein
VQVDFYWGLNELTRGKNDVSPLLLYDAEQGCNKKCKKLQMSAVISSGDINLEKKMSMNVVNLDALIPREDFAVAAQTQHANALEKISVIHLEGPFFEPDLRKPDFQRETTQWNPTKVVDLIRAFVDADLIPAVILWRSGQYIFVIDGAHRLSALLAWIFDDYGNRKQSLEFFGGHISDDQRTIAKRTRDLVNKEVGSYQDYVAARKNIAGAPEPMQKRLSNLAVNSVIAQWVPTTDVKSAEDSFFKINQAATPIDPTERRILKARNSPNALAARAITHPGSGHKYWNSFNSTAQASIESIGSIIYHALYDPAIGGSTITTLDVPVAGRGYNALPFVVDLVNECNAAAVADTTTTKDIKENLPVDPDGSLTLKYLKSVKDRLDRITGDSPSSLGIHPVVYFYTRSGAFQPTALIATSRFLESLARKGNLEKFTSARRQFEQFLIDHKEAMSLLIHKFGSGGRSLPWLETYYERVLEGFLEGKNPEEIQQDFTADPDFTYLTVPRPGVGKQSTGTKRSFSSNTKTATFFAAALLTAPRCQICGGVIHRNSMQFDHIIRVREGGANDMSNSQLSHPYCNSTYKN